MISRIVQTEVNVINVITFTEVWVMEKPNPIIVLLYIQNSHTKTHAINHLQNFVIFVDVVSVQ